jgi:CheY-like chemotaxis protein
VDSVSVLIKKKASDKGIRYRHELSDHLPKMILTDKLRLTQILLNLCQNAIKFTEEGEVLLTVLPVGKEEDNQQVIRFVIKDTGIGIPEGRQEQVFDRFVQASEKISGKYGGTGLGLTIVKSLVEYFGGQIRLESKEGTGTTFTIELPVTVIEVPEENAKPESEEVISPIGLAGLRILAAEDNLLNQRLLSANNGKEAIDKLVAEAFDVIIMDVQMPEMDGYTAIREIRNNLKLTTPIIMMTAHAMAGEREEGLRIGANAYLSKPFQKQELFSVIMGLTQKTVEVDPVTASTSPERKDQVKSHIDYQYLREITGGNDDLRNDLIGLFGSDGIKQLNSVKEALAGSDYVVLKQAIHKFRSSLFSVGLLTTANKLKLIENELSAERIPDDLQQSIELISQEVLEGLEELRAI